MKELLAFEDREIKQQQHQQNIQINQTYDFEAIQSDKSKPNKYMNHTIHLLCSMLDAYACIRKRGLYNNHSMFIIIKLIDAIIQQNGFKVANGYR